MSRRSRSWLKLSVTVLLLVFLASCALFEKSAKIKYPNKVTPEMEVAYNQAEKDFQAKKYKLAAVAFQSYLQRFSYNRLTDQSQYRLGQIEMLNRKYLPAYDLFASLIQKTPDPSIRSRARVKAGICQYRLKNKQQALHQFSQLEGQFIRRHDKIKAAGLALVILNQSGAVLEKKAYYYAMLADAYQGMNGKSIKARYGKEAPSRKVALEQLGAWSRSAAPPSQIDNRFATYYKGPVSGPYVDFKLGKSFQQAGNDKKAKMYWGNLVSQYPNSPQAREVKPLLAQMGYKPSKARKGRVFKVGVILPLSGKYEKFGVGTLNGMECAAGMKAGCSGVGNIQLVVRDDGGSPATAIKVVQELVEVEKVMVIVGPLSSASAVAAAKKAQELGVVLISLAQKEGIPSVGPNIFRFSLTPDQQVKALLTYAAKKKGKKDIGILYPNNNYGQVFLKKFKDLAPRYEARVAAESGYKNSKDMATALRNLKFSVSKSSPEMLLGFNAIFIPDSYIAILNILPQLKMAALDTMFLMGTNAWNDASLASRSGDALANSVFLDIYFKGSKRSQVRAFIQEFQAAFGQTPSTLQAMGYDIIRFIGQLTARQKVKKQGDFRLVLIGAKNYQGVTGLRSFAANREARIRPYLLTVQDGQIKEVGK